MHFFKRFIFFVPLILFMQATQAQQKHVSKKDSAYLYNYALVERSLNGLELTKEDSLLIEDLNKLNWYSVNDSVRRSYANIQLLLNNHTAEHNIAALKAHWRAIQDKKPRYDSLIFKQSELRQIKATIDTGMVSTEDSNFMDYIDMLFPENAVDTALTDSVSFVAVDSLLQDTVRIDSLQLPAGVPLDSLVAKDSLRVDTMLIDTLIQESFLPDTLQHLVLTEEERAYVHKYQPYFQNDSLLNALNNLIKYYESNEIIEWVDKVRRDTFDFFIIGAENDSIHIELYRNNPELVRLPIADIWGNKIPAIIRNIQPNSIKILIDDAPELMHDKHDHAAEALNKFKKGKFKSSGLQFKERKEPDVWGDWRAYGNTSLDMSQIGMYRWAQGGEPSLSFLLGSDLYLDYKVKGHSWNNHLLVRYGMIRTGRYVDKEADKFSPNVDRLEFNSTYGLKTSEHYNVTFEGDFKSQFSPQIDEDNDNELLSTFMSPAYLTFSVGYELKGVKNTTLFLYPLSSKTTVVLEDLATVKQRYNVDTTKISRHEFGFRLKGTNKWKVWDDIVMANTVELYSNYLYKPKNIDINWEMTLTFPVNDYIQATFGTHLIYDDDQAVPKYRWVEEDDGSGNVEGSWEKYEGPGLQFKELIKLGVKIIF